MSKKVNQTASFMVRFTQTIFEDGGEDKIQWLGKVSHVQGGDQQNFGDFEDAIEFIQLKLQELTLDATQDKTPEEQIGLLNKSLYIWKKVAKTGPKILLETIKDPKKQVANLQDQIQDQISTISDELSTKVALDQWRNASRSDFKKMMKAIDSLSSEMKGLNKEVKRLAKNQKSK